MVNHVVECEGNLSTPTEPIIQERGIGVGQVYVKKAAQLAAEFLLNFERYFEKAPIQEQKELIRQVVLGVRVNPDKRIATCGITKIPMENRELKTLINPSEFTSLEHTVGAHCSGGRT